MMKKSIILALMMGGVLMFSSCEKDKEPITNPATNQTVSAQMTDQEVEAKIKGFIAKVKSGDKSITSMSAEDAVWNIEAALNYTFCINEVAVVPVETIELTFNYATNENGELDFYSVADLFNIYSKEIEKAKTKENYISLVDVDVEEMTISYVLSIEANDKDFTGGSWRYGNDEGNCDLYNAPTDAADHIKAGITAKFYRPGVYWTGITNRQLSFVENDDISKNTDYNPGVTGSSTDLRYDYVPWVRMSNYFKTVCEANDDYCIDESIIDYYIERTYEVMDLQDGSMYMSPCGWHNPSASASYGDYQTTNSYGPYLYHRVDYKYGTHHIEINH